MIPHEQSTDTPMTSIVYIYVGLFLSLIAFFVTDDQKPEISDRTSSRPHPTNAAPACFSPSNKVKQNSHVIILIFSITSPYLTNVFKTD